MLNQVILVGRLMDDPVMIENKSTITLQIQRPHKDPETNEYDSDIIQATLWDTVAETTVEYCTKGSIVGIKASLQTNEEGHIEVKAEKITFINTKKRGN